MSHSDALKKLEMLINGFETSWLGNPKKFKVQLDRVVETLQLGAYALPKRVLNSEVLKMHLLDCLKKDLNECLEDLRMGLVFRVPCRAICSVLNDYLRVTTDHFPYRFYNVSKTTVYASTLASEQPMRTVKLHCGDGKRQYRLFLFHVQVLESHYPNVYFGLVLMGYGQPIWSSLGRVRSSELPKFKMVTLKALLNGSNIRQGMFVFQKFLKHRKYNC